jgi:hypothetical protein
VSASTLSAETRPGQGAPVARQESAEVVVRSGRRVFLAAGIGSSATPFAKMQKKAPSIDSPLHSLFITFTFNRNSQKKETLLTAAERVRPSLRDFAMAAAASAAVGLKQAAKARFGSTSAEA